MGQAALLDDSYGKIEEILLTYVDEYDIDKINSFLDVLDNDVSVILAYDGQYIEVPGLSEGRSGGKRVNNHGFIDLLDNISREIKLLPLQGPVPKWPQDRFHVLNNGDETYLMSSLPPNNSSLNLSQNEVSDWLLVNTDFWEERDYRVVENILGRGYSESGDIVPVGRKLFIGAHTYYAMFKGKEIAYEKQLSTPDLYFPNFSPRERRDYRKVIEKDLKMIKTFLKNWSLNEHTDFLLSDFVESFDLIRGDRTIYRVGLGNDRFTPIEEHIDLLCTFLDENTVIVGDYNMAKKEFGDLLDYEVKPAYKKLHNKLDKLAKNFEKDGFEVIRIPLFPSGNKEDILTNQINGREVKQGMKNPFLTYNNSLFEIYNSNGSQVKVAYIPSYGIEADQMAKEVYMNQGFEVRQLDMLNAARWIGAVRCSAKVLRRS